MFGLGRIRSEYGYLCRREIGLNEQNRDVASKDDFCVRRFGLTGRLRGHVGCVNRLAWNQDGSYLASVSDDTNIMIWPYPQGMPYTVPTLHTSNIFGVQFLPHTNSSVLVTGAMDCNVGLHRILEGGGNLVPISGPRYDGFLENDLPVDVGEDGSSEDESMIVSGQQREYPLAEHTFFSCHTDRVKDVEVSHADPYMFWSASEDGTVRQYDYRMNPREQSEERSPNALLHFRNLPMTAHRGISSIRINPMRPEMLAVASQRSHVLIFDRRRLSTSTVDNLVHVRDSNQYFGGEPILDLSAPPVDICLHLTHAPRCHFPTYLSFGSKGDKVLASYSLGPAVSFSCLTSDSGSAKGTPYWGRQHAFDFARSRRELSFFGNRDRVDEKEALKWYTTAMPSGCRRPNPTRKYTIRCMKNALSENPYDYRLFCLLHELYTQERILSPSNAYASLMMAEYAVRLAPKDTAFPYFLLLDALKKCDFVLASLFVLILMDKMLKGRASDYDTLDAQGDLTNFRNGIYPVIQAEYKTTKAMLDKLFDSAFQGETPQEWIDMSSQLLSPSPFELEYIRAWGTSFTKGLPTPIVLMAHTNDNFLQSYHQHRNAKTDIKEAVYFGSNDEYVIAASDSGLAVVYDANSGEAENFLRADSEILNCVRPHPFLPVIATSGIEPTVKVWTPYGGQRGACVYPDPSTWPDVNEIEHMSQSDFVGSIMNPFIDMMADTVGGLERNPGDFIPHDFSSFMSMYGDQFENAYDDYSDEDDDLY